MRRRCYRVNASCQRSLRSYHFNHADFIEGIWAELRRDDVHVIFCALGPTDTPAFRDLLARKNAVLLPGLAAPADVADQVLGQLANGPVMNWALADDDRGYLPSSAAERRQRVVMLDEGSKRIYGAA